MLGGFPGHMHLEQDIDGPSRTLRAFIDLLQKPFVVDGMYQVHERCDQFDLVASADGR